MRIHFIAIGGSVMHNLAIALKRAGKVVTGSDDEIFEPSRSRLASNGLLPSTEGWNTSLIDNSIDAVILGMHARKDNPELLRALELGIKVYSYPEFIHDHSLHKQRVVVAGSHGKTTVTAMIMHALKDSGIDFDYMIGAGVEGFESTVRLSDSARVIIIEGDEYLSSPIDPTPKFLWYKPHLAVITGISWDHINVFPVEEEYKRQFSLFAKSVMTNGLITYHEEDNDLRAMMLNLNIPTRIIGYKTLANEVKGKSTMVLHQGKDYHVGVFGSHNFQNMAAALNICLELGITANKFLSSMSSFKGAARRLQLLGENNNSAVFHDFAHAPSKLLATVKAMKERYPRRHLTACIELHTFSSLSADFLPRYSGTMNDADCPVVFFDPEVLARKNLAPVSRQQVAEAFNIPLEGVVTNIESLEKLIMQPLSCKEKNLLIMSSGNFGGIKPSWFSEKWLD